MMPQRRWQGLWRNKFESTVFCEVPAVRCLVDSQPENTWITFSDPLDPRLGHAGEGLYRIDFLGRRTLIPGSYGHMGIARHEIVVDRVLFLDPAGAPRR